MLKIRHIATLLLLLTTQLIFAQRTSSRHLPHKCATDQMREYLSQQDQSYFEREQIIDYQIAQHLRKRRRPGQEANKNPGQIYTLPVVVHVIHSGVPVGTDENISDATIIQGIQHLNEAFRNQTNYDPSTGADTEIEFCLAQRDPNGNATNGINRVSSPLTDIETDGPDDLALKSLVTWDQTEYINIWLVREITSPTNGSGVAGYAYLASAHGRPMDGIVNEARWFGSSVDNSKVHIHEVGHYLNLYHTFEGACENSNCMTSGDHVCDTPPDASTAGTACTSVVNTCTTDSDDPSSQNPFSPTGSNPGDQPDMTNNYMDYNSQVCQNAFTQGQKERMIAALETARSSLLSSKGCVSPCLNPIAFNPAYSDTADIGQTITFSTPNQSGVTFRWDFGDGSSSTTGNSVSHIYNNVGSFTVTLHGTNSDPNCSDSIQIPIEIECNTSASFTTSDTEVTTNSTVSFINSSSANSTSFRWYVDGNFETNNVDLSYTFNNQGSYSVQLIADGPLCADTSESVRILVGACGQSKQGNVWAFGSNAGIDFSTGTPVAFSGVAMNQREGVASMSDTNGTLLFYTDGRSVWNSNHQVMPNGAGLTGDPTSAQSSIIIPAPGNASRYYIFTVKDWTQTDSRMRYSIVDMTLDGGNGDIVNTSKNIILRSNTFEQITAVIHENCRDVWIITHDGRSANPNRFVAYLLDPSGVSTTPVTSDVGSDHLGSNRYGSLRASHNGRKLCSALGGSTNSPTVEVFDFDRATGVVSNPIVISTMGANGNAYSSEFSPNDRILYVTSFNGSFIYQYDLSLPTEAAIQNSQINISTSNSTKPALQMGPDGKIYCSIDNRAYLGVIDNPNALGNLSNYIENGVALSTGTNGRLGLPNFLPGFFGDAIAINGPMTACSNGIAKYDINASGCVDSVTWIYSGGGQIINQDSISITIDFAGDTGIHTLEVQARDQCGIISDKITIEVNNEDPPEIDLGRDTLLCQTSITLDPAGPFNRYIWQDGSTDTTFLVSDTGTYWVDVINTKGCIARDSIHIGNVTPNPPLEIGNDTTLCFGEIIVLKSENEYHNYNWSTGSTDRQITIFQPIAEPDTITVSLQVSNGCGDNASESITIIYEQCDSCSVEITAIDSSLCRGSSFELEATDSMLLYEWSPANIFTESNDRITEALLQQDTAVIYVTAIDSSGCIAEDSITLISYVPPSVTTLPDTAICLSDSIQLLTSTADSITSWRWSPVFAVSNDTVSEPYFRGVSSASLKVIATDTNNCTDSALVTITINPNPDIDILGDTIICQGMSTDLAANSPSATQFEWSPSATLSNSDQMITSATPLSDSTKYFLTVIDGNNCSSDDSITIYFESGIESEITIPTGIEVCEDQTVTINSSGNNLGSNPKYYWILTEMNGLSDTVVNNSPDYMLNNPKNYKKIQLGVIPDLECPSDSVIYSNIFTPEVYTYPVLGINGDTTICSSTTFTLEAETENTGIFIWVNTTTGDTLSTQLPELELQIEEDQSYTVSTSNWNCSVTSDTHHIRVISPYIDLTASDSIIDLGDEVYLSVKTNTDNFKWITDPFAGAIPNSDSLVLDQPLNTTLYTVIGEINGCIVHDTIAVVVLKIIEAPYLFSPNGDGENDLWIVKNLDQYTDQHIEIFNRWGMKVREIKNRNTWDGLNDNGNQLPTGTYYYIIKANKGTEPLSITGYVNLLY